MITFRGDKYKPEHVYTADEYHYILLVRDHWLYKLIPRHRKDLKWYNPFGWITWALFGNDDDGIFGEEETSGSSWLGEWGRDISFRRFVRWNIRNPLHNFMFYVIGISWMKNIPQTPIVILGDITNFFGKGEEAPKSVWPQGEKGIALVLRGYVLPFLSLRIPIGSKRVEGYIGWRERGSFGMSLRIKTIQID